MLPRVVAITLNYNNAKDTIECVDSLMECTYQNLGILVVDNGSQDDSASAIRSTFSDIQIVQTGKNLGFSGGNNVGVIHALTTNPEYILLLNNDTIVESGFLEPLVSALEENKQAAAAGGTICYYGERNKVWYAGGRYVPWRASCFADFLGAPVSDIPHSSPRQVTFITGCLMLIRAASVRTLGLFDERFFMYFEDAEFSLRLIAKGYKLLHVPRSRIYHKINTQPDTPFAIYFCTRNRLLFVQIATKGWRRLLALVYLYPVIFLKLIFWRAWRPDLFDAVRMGIRDYRAGELFEGRAFSLSRQR